jgi:flagellar basal-body rod protein FlgG
MFQAMRTAATALRSQQIRLDTIGNNIANLNTTAFKGTRINFRDALYTTGITPGPPRTPDGNQQRGHGLMIASARTDFNGGNLIRTEAVLDFALEGEGFFQLGDLAGNTFFTRSGHFTISAEADGNYIVNANGLYLLDVNGERIRMDSLTHTINVGTDGEMVFISPDGETTANLAIVTFRNLTGLYQLGSSLFQESEASGEMLVPEGTIVRQGMLEGSNVELAQEMTRMIRTQRAFSLASRALTTADEMEGIANNMRR